MLGLSKRADLASLVVSMRMQHDECPWCAEWHDKPHLADCRAAEAMGWPRRG